MKKMIIFESDICSSKEAVNSELLRVDAIINNLKTQDIEIERYNLTSNPQAFIDNKKINQLINIDGTDVLPITMIDGEIAKMKAYPTDEEFFEMLDAANKTLKANVIECGCRCKVISER